MRRVPAICRVSVRAGMKKLEGIERTRRGNCDTRVQRYFYGPVKERLLCECRTLRHLLEKEQAKKLMAMATVLLLRCWWAGPLLVFLAQLPARATLPPLAGTEAIEGAARRGGRCYKKGGIKTLSWDCSISTRLSWPREEVVHYQQDYYPAVLSSEWRKTRKAILKQQQQHALHSGR